MIEILAVALGGAVGSVGRYLVVLWLPAPAGTLAVNLVGGFAMGVVAALVEAIPALPPAVRLLLATGILGGFTTFSAFALDTMHALDRGAYGTALAYAGLSVLGSVAALAIGRAVARALL